MRFFVICLVALSPAIASAQQVSPAELALNIDQGVNNLAATLTNAQKQIAADEARIKDLEKQLADLKHVQKNDK